MESLVKLDDPEAQKLLDALVILTREEPVVALRRALEERIERERRVEKDLVKDRSEELWGY